MSITSTIFLFCFLPIALVLYYIVGKRVKEYVLLFVSLFFYACGSAEFLVVFLIAVSLTVCLGRLLFALDDSKVLYRRLILTAGILLNASLLVFCKYSTRFDLLPLGLSFFTFKAISYLADIYKIVISDMPVVHDALYLSFFGQIQAGPLSRYEEMKYDASFNKFSEGVFRFFIGFAKKILLADTLSKISTEIFSAGADSLTLSYAWLGAIAYSLELFFDFAGYSDMAIGLTKMFGYDCRENFIYPYMTESVSKFWRRWHITLSEWFRDYVYIPLGGSRTSRKWQVYFNLLVVWVLTGIWHGTSGNFILWGLGYFVLISFERLTGLPNKFKSRFGKIIYRVFSLIFIIIEWVMFRSSGISAGIQYIKHMIVPTANSLSDFRALFIIKEYGIFLAVSILLCFPIYPMLEKNFEDGSKKELLFNAISLVIVFVCFIMALSFVISGQNNPFAYANF